MHDECLPKNWINSSVPVIFDFKGTENIPNPLDERNLLFLLYPKRNREPQYLAFINRERLIDSIISGDLFRKKEEPVKETEQPLPQQSNVQRRASDFIFDNKRNRFIKRRRL